MEHVGMLYVEGDLSKEGPVEENLLAEHKADLSKVNLSKENLSAASWITSHPHTIKLIVINLPSTTLRHFILTYTFQTSMIVRRHLYWHTMPLEIS